MHLILNNGTQKKARWQAKIRPVSFHALEVIYFCLAKVYFYDRIGESRGLPDLRAAGSAAGSSRPSWGRRWTTCIRSWWGYPAGWTWTPGPSGEAEAGRTGCPTPPWRWSRRSRSRRRWAGGRGAAAEAEGSRCTIRSCWPPTSPTRPRCGRARSWAWAFSPDSGSSSLHPASRAGWRAGALGEADGPDWRDAGVAAEAEAATWSSSIPPTRSGAVRRVPSSRCSCSDGPSSLCSAYIQRTQLLPLHPHRPTKPPLQTPR